MRNSISSEAHNQLVSDNYSYAQSLYEQLIEQQPETKSHYWYLGLSLLLQGKEEEAQITWIMGVDQFDDQQQSIEDLCKVLENESLRQEGLNNFQLAWLIRKHLKEINQLDLNNLLNIILLSIKVGIFTPKDIEDLNVLEILSSENQIPIYSKFLSEILQYLIDYYPDSQSLINFAGACLRFDIHRFFPIVFAGAVNFARTLGRFDLAIRMSEACLQVDPVNLEILKHTVVFYYSNQQFHKSVEVAMRCLSAAKKIEDKICVNSLYLNSLIAIEGHSDQVSAELESQKSLLVELFNKAAVEIDRNATIHLFPSTFLFPYSNDDPIADKAIRNQLMSICQTSLKTHASEQVKEYYLNKPSNNKVIKVGYISECLRRHSVGWLARWVFKYHDRDRVSINTYFVCEKNCISDSNQEWIALNSDKSVKCGLDGAKIAQLIFEDDIDILVDLDSLTSDICSEVISLKPAPIQVTWLGWDSSGIPGVNYFIADKYVLPDNAQSYYSEKILRLPNSYIAIDGFEASVPTLSRNQLSIAEDSVIYLSIQSIFKLHPQIVRSQIQIIKSVNNSYLLIKGVGDQEAIKRFVTKISEEEGLDINRLRFLGATQTEAEHRANLSIADVVLDTYPYNGATTTMETLWMCIPLVTRVGQQFAARNSYTMMMNAGITEGIAWTDQEYIDWGVRLGTDENLRKQVFWKLKESRKTSPLWNAKQFTRDLEDAYQQMWENYLLNIN